MCVPFGTEHPIQNLRRKKLQPKRWYAGLELSVWKSGFRFCTGDKLRVQSSATRKVLPPIGSGRVARCVADDPDKFGAVQVYTTPRRTRGACSSRRCPRREVCASPRASVHHCAGWHWRGRDGAGDAAAARAAGAATTARTTRTNRRARARSASPSSSARRTPTRAGASIRRPTYGHRSRPPPSCIRATRCTAMASISVQPTTRRSTTIYASTGGRMTRVAHHYPRTSGLPRSLRPAAILGYYNY